MRYKYVVKPTVYACSLTFLKDQLRITDTQHDSYLQSLIIASMAMANDFTGRQLNRATMLAYTNFNGAIYEINRGPVISITKIEIVKENNDVVELPSQDYYLINEELSGIIVIANTATLDLADSTRPDGIRITYVAGYGEEAPMQFPEEIKNAVALYASRMYLNPDNAIDERNTTSDNLLKQYRCPIV